MDIARPSNGWASGHPSRRAAGAPIDAVVAVPGSKSIANRALVCAALADGASTFHNLPDGDDTEAMLACLELLGVGVGRGEQTVVVGTGGNLRPGPIELPTRLAGTTSRFITALAALGPGPYLIDGEPPPRARPMSPLHDALVALGATLHPGERWGHLPVTVSGPLQPIERLEVRGDISSQFLTALMLIGPYVAGGLRIAITTPLVSRSYVEITKTVMPRAGHDAVTSATPPSRSRPAGTRLATTRSSPMPVRRAIRLRLQRSPVVGWRFPASRRHRCRATRVLRGAGGDGMHVATRSEVDRGRER